MPGAFYCLRQCALVFSACARATSGFYLATVRYIALKHWHIFIVYYVDMISAKGTDLTLGYEFAGLTPYVPSPLGF